MSSSELFAPKTLNLDGLDITYYDSENERGNEGETLVLIHGTGGAIQTHFSFVYPILATKYRVVGFDWADPTDGKRPLELDDLVAQAAAVIKETAADSKVTLIGYSLGAVTAAATAARHPELVDQLVVISGWARTDYQQGLRHRIYNTLAQQDDLGPLRAWTMYSAYSADFLLAQLEDKLTAMEQLITKSDFSHRQMELNSRIDITADVASITAPTLILSANEDVMVPPHHQRQLFGAIENSRLARVNSGHACVYERAPELVHHILEFVEQPDRYEAGTIVPVPQP